MSSEIEVVQALVVSFRGFSYISDTLSPKQLLPLFCHRITLPKIQLAVLASPRVD